MEPEKSRDEEIKVEVAKKTARIREICKRHDLEIDTETEEIIRFVLSGAIVQGIGRLITRDWIVCQELKFFYEARRDSTRQRILEHLSDIMGYGSSGKAKEALVVDAIIGEVGGNGDSQA